MDNLLADIFSGDAFSAVSLTDSINNVPNMYGRVNQLGIFEDRSVVTNVAMLEFSNGELNLIPTSARGTPAPKNKTGKRSAKPLEIPRVALDDLILPADIQNVRAFGSVQLQTPESVTNDKLVELARKHDITNEYLKCGALAGNIVDADGSTLLNLFTEFSVSQQIQDFAFTDADTDVLALANEVSGMTEDELKGDVMTSVYALCSPTFWAAFIAHASVKEAFKFYQVQQNSMAGYAGLNGNPIRDDVRKGFNFGGITWEEYRGKATYLNGTTSTSRPFIPTDTARFFPIGTTQTFRNYNAPADWMETVNTPGLRRYAKVVPDAGGRHVEVLSQSNPLPICTRPRVLVKGTMS